MATQRSTDASLPSNAVGPSSVTLRLFNDEPAPADIAAAGTTGEPSPAMRLSEFFDAWYLPIALETEGRHDGTVTSYRESIAWWRLLTGDPPIRDITQFTVRDFKEGLRKVTYRRGKLGSDRLLTKYTQTKHARQVRAVLRRTGPTTSEKTPCCEIVERVPYIPAPVPKRPTPKRTPSVDEMRAIVAATARMPRPMVAERWIVPPRDWWHAFVVVMFYVGLRRGTTLKLEFEMLDERPDGWWLIIPGAIVDKTEKPLDKFLHPCAHYAIERLRRYDPQRKLIFTWPCGVDWIGQRHDTLLELAGVGEPRRFSPQGWRRAHSREMDILGAGFGRKMAQRALDHADERTTSGFYSDIEALLISQLPVIDSPDLWGSEQLLLF